MSEWKLYSGSDEQIAEMWNADSGFITKPCMDNDEDNIEHRSQYLNPIFMQELLHAGVITHYLICNPHPLRDMIKRQADTGQPVYYKYQRSDEYGNLIHNDYEYGCTYQPNWYHPNTEYSFTPFEEK